MANSISFWKKIRLFLFYVKTIRSIKDELFKNYFIRVDWAYRLYTVLNIPENLIDEPYRNRTKDIDAITDVYVKEYYIELANFLNSKGLMELFYPYSKEKVGRFSYLIVLGFSLFKSNIFFRNLLILISTISAISIFLYLK